MKAENNPIPDLGAGKADAVGEGAFPGQHAHREYQARGVVQWVTKSPDITAETRIFPTGHENIRDVDDKGSGMDEAANRPFRCSERGNHHRADSCNVDTNRDDFGRVLHVGQKPS